MNQTTRLIYPTVDLFLYDLPVGLGQGEDQLQRDRERFWRRVYDGDLDERKLAALQEIEERNPSSYIELLGEQRVARFQPPLDGYYYPVKLGNTYALKISCSGKSDDPAWETLSTVERVQALKAIALDHARESTAPMGRTWLIWGKANDSGGDLEAIARELHEAIEGIPDPDWTRDLQGVGTYRGATLFELEHPNRSGHVIIGLFPRLPRDRDREDSRETIGELSPHLLRLFLYRHKILWFNQRGRQLRNALKSSGQAVEKLVNSFSTRASDSRFDPERTRRDLEEALSLYYYYQTSWSYLREQAANLQINTRNYQQRARAIARLDPEGDARFWERFGEFAEETYLARVEVNTRVLSAGLQPLENLVKTVEGITEVEKTQTGRSLNRIAAIASAGIGVAAITAFTFDARAQGIIDTLFPIPLYRNPSVLHYLASFGLAWGVSLAIGSLAAGITAWISRDQTKG